MSGCERGRRTRCERGAEIHPTNRATTTPTSTSSTSTRTSTTTTTSTHHQDHHQPTAAAPPAAQAPTTPVRTTPAQPSALTQRPAQPAPAPPAAVPPPAPAPHAGIYSVHVSMYAQDSKIYSYILQSKKNVGTQVLVSTRVWNAYRCSIQHINMHTQANCENANTRALEVEKEQRLRTTLIWYMHYKSKSKKSPKYCGHADWYDFPPSDATSSDPGKVKHKLNAACTWPVGPLAKCKTATKRYVHIRSSYSISNF